MMRSLLVPLLAGLLPALQVVVHAQQDIAVTSTARIHLLAQWTDSTTSALALRPDTPRSDFPSPLPTAGLPPHAETKPVHKSPVLAWFLSWLISGGGQAYNGQWTKAALFFGAGAIGFAMAASNGGFQCSGDCTTNDVGLGIWVASSLGSQIDAPISASRINKKAKERQASGQQVTLLRLRF